MRWSLHAFLNGNDFSLSDQVSAASSHRFGNVFTFADAIILSMGRELARAKRGEINVFGFIGRGVLCYERGRSFYLLEMVIFRLVIHM